MQVRTNQVRLCTDGKCKYEKMKLAQASTDGATIDGSRWLNRHYNKTPKQTCELKIKK